MGKEHSVKKIEKRTINKGNGKRTTNKGNKKDQ